MTREYLICVGVMKAGTTLLYDLLRQHPGVRAGKVKELHYFDEAESPDKAAYDQLFRKGSGIKMDVTPMYMYDPATLDKLCRALDPAACAILVLLRDPIERAWSHYRMRVSQDLEPLPFEETLPAEPGRIAQRARGGRIHGYFTGGLYAGQLDALYARFPRENIKVMLFEDFIRDQQAAVDEICAFVGLEKQEITPTVSNAGVVHHKSRLVAKIVKWLTRLVPNALKTDGMRRLKYALVRLNRDDSVKDVIPETFLPVLKGYYREDVERLGREYGIDTNKWKHFKKKRN